MHRLEFFSHNTKVSPFSFEPACFVAPQGLLGKFGALPLNDIFGFHGAEKKSGRALFIKAPEQNVEVF